MTQDADTHTADTQPAGADSAPLEKMYDPHRLERAIYSAWEQANRFAPADGERAYCIMLPPPNVTGSLHMGHAFQHTLMDALMRYRRMHGDSALWQGGTDHAGIATQMVVERRLAADGKTRHDLGREKFLQCVWEWKAQSGGRIGEQMRRLGASVDWSRERFTMDAGLSQAVTEVFVKLYEQDLIYRGKRLVNWDPVLHTAVSDLEVISEEEAGFMWHIRYPIVGSKNFLVVATTRPETLLGDAAVAVHPDDERYRALIGKHVELPLTGRTVPVIADAYVDKAFGSGCVKITPAHDFNDYEVGKRHHLPLINVMTPDARIKDSSLQDFSFGHRAPDKRGTSHADEDGLRGSPTIDYIPAAYRGLDRFEARKRIVADLEARGLLEKIEPHKLKVPRGDRTNAVIEPLLTDQWYVKAAPLAAPAIKAVEDGRIKFVPENWSKTYYDWMHNIQDWCISRQIWWGHRIPAWYDDAGKVYVGRSEDDVRAKHKLGTRALTQDDDVLDTWFSSALWPFSTLGWPEATPELKKFYPTNVLVTGFDIIFFWVARMIMMGLHFMDDVPFHEVYVTGLVRDGEGQKMSKSKGNIIDPLDLIDGITLDDLLAKRTAGLMQPQMAKRIEQATRKQFPDGIPAFGTDALRFTLAILATQGRDIKFDLGRIEGYRNFCNKLWNAARYVLMNTDGKDCGAAPGAKLELTLAERWIRARLQQTVLEVEHAFKNYRFDLAAQAIYGFIWDEYCSWYLELSKVVLTDASADPAVARGTRHTLVHVLETALRLLHPIMPFITEAIWQKVAPLAGVHGDTVMLQPYPPADAATIDGDAIDEMRWVMQVVTGIRNIRGEMDINPGKPLAVLLQNGGAQDQAYLERNRHYLAGLARLSDIVWLDAQATAPESATALVGNMKVLIPLAGLIDKDAELKRLERDIDKLAKDLQKEQGKLANASFVDRAPPAVVEETKQRVRDFEQKLASLKTQQQKVAAL